MRRSSYAGRPFRTLQRGVSVHARPDTPTLHAPLLLILAHPCSPGSSTREEIRERQSELGPNLLLFPPKITKNWLPPVGDPRFAVDSSHCPCTKASCRILSKGGMSERAKARVGCLLIQNTGRWRALYAGEVPKARLGASSRP
jgi:hypothetical protein